MARRDAAEASARFLDEAQVLLLTIYLPDGIAYCCNQRADVTSRGQVYSGGVQIGLPQDDGKPAEVTATIAHAGTRLANLIHEANDAVKLLLEVVADTDPDTVIDSYLGLVLRSAEVGYSTASFTLRQDIPIEEPVSGLRATGAYFPGVEYGW